MSTTKVHDLPEPVHVVALSGCHTLADKIWYACEHNRPDPTTATVRDWLARYHVDTEESYVSTMVSAWRSKHTQPDTVNAAVSTAAITTGGTAVGTPATAAPSEVGRPAETPSGVTGFLTVAAMSMLVSIDTSWRFFEQVLHISNVWERLVMFTVLEVALLACGWGMRANVHRTGRPGAPRLIAWLLCGIAAYMAWQLSGVAAGVARVALGPVLGLVMLHLALGIEIRAGQHRVTTWARIGREMRERFLSRLGLADDARDALARTRDRAARRAARLSLATGVLFRSARVARALRASNVAHDPAARARMLSELAAIRHAGDLATLSQPSPWLTTEHNTGQRVNTSPARSVNGTGNGAVNGVVNAAAPVRERRPRSAPAVRKPRLRRKLADYVTEAREHLTPDVQVTPAWVRTVIPGCPRSTSKNVADALKQERENERAEVMA